jgi:hypothetical protein
MEPDDCSYVFGGFCPITIRLIETLVKKGWNSIKEVIKRLPGEFEYPANEKEIISSKNRTNFILLVFIGGISYAEISAIRHLNRTLKGKLILNKFYFYFSKKSQNRSQIYYPDDSHHKWQEIHIRSSPEFRNFNDI